jgi:3-oxoacyl-[acyl-carrier-protein] synthase-1
MPDVPPLNLVAIGDRIRFGEESALLSNSFAFAGSNASLVLGRGRVA